MTARVALEKVAGVEDADASYEEGSAVVTFDPTATSPAEFIGELTRLTGFTAEVVEARETERTQGTSASSADSSQ